MKITLEGKEYNLNIDAAKEAGILEEIVPRRVISLGQKYKNRYTKNIYLIARTGHNLVNLINIASGDRLIGLSTGVHNVYNINDAEFNLMTESNSHLFDFVELEITIK